GTRELAVDAGQDGRAGHRLGKDDDRGSGVADIAQHRGHTGKRAAGKRKDTHRQIHSISCFDHIRLAYGKATATRADNSSAGKDTPSSSQQTSHFYPANLLNKTFWIRKIHANGYTADINP
ncbi:unnamed protein product, partial [Rangifer tarandus platyrhynchus]